MSDVVPDGSQFERTRLAWRRTILALIAVGGIGAIHLAVSGYVLEASIVILLTVASLAPAVHRLRRLRRLIPAASWQPAVLTIAACLMALTVFVPD